MTQLAPRQQGQKSWQFPLGHGRACPGHPDNRALRHPDRDRRDKPGDDAMSFAPLTPRAGELAANPPSTLRRGVVNRTSLSINATAALAAAFHGPQILTAMQTTARSNPRL